MVDLPLRMFTFLYNKPFITLIIQYEGVGDISLSHLYFHLHLSCENAYVYS